MEFKSGTLLPDFFVPVIELIVKNTIVDIHSNSNTILSNCK